jgi:hypothetical protein
LSEHAVVPPEIVAELRAVCLALPETYEEQAWVGTRWRIRKRTFAHVLTVDSGWPPAYARAAATNGPVTMLMFRSSGPELGALAGAGHPFFKPPWRGQLLRRCTKEVRRPRQSTNRMRHDHLRQRRERSSTAP